MDFRNPIIGAGNHSGVFGQERDHEGATVVEEVSDEPVDSVSIDSKQIGDRIIRSLRTKSRLAGIIQ